jgi:hypothetical protein
LSGVARCWHSNAYFSLFSSLFFFDPPSRERYRELAHKAIQDAQRSHHPTAPTLMSAE